METQDTERIIKGAVEYLIAQGKEYEARLLLVTRLALDVADSDIAFSISGDAEIEVLDYSARLEVEPKWLDNMRKGLNEQRKAIISNAIQEALQSYHGVKASVRSVYVNAAMALEASYPLWRETYEAQLIGDDSPLNQAAVGTSTPLFQWNGLRFRSHSEQAIAAAFAKAKVLFFPLAAAVSELKKYEPDFVVCLNGKWGILEVHGEPFHASAKDSERRRWFLTRGIKVVEFYDSNRCYKEPDKVVAEFLSILKSI